MNVDHPTKLTHVSLCTGYGGIDLGLSRALGRAVRNVAYVEIEAFAASNLVAKIENGHLDTAPIFTDLKRFPWRRFRGRVDILSGGFPCQPFSAAGRRAGDEDPRHLFPYILDGLRELGRPPLVFLENVEGIISSKLKGDGWADPEGTPVLLHVLRELERVGYDATAGVFSAREIGAPHQRKRVFILACRSDLSESGRALVSEMLERGRGPRVGNSESRSRTSPSWGRKPKLKRVQLPLRESGTAHPAPRGADVEHTTRRQDTRRESRNPRGEGAPTWAKEFRESTHTGPTAYPAPRGADVEDTDSRQRPWLSEHRPSKDTELTQSRKRDLTRAPSPTNDRTGYPAPRGAEQHAWEPPRVTREAQSAMGRDPNGAPGGMGYAELCRSVDNRTDELRLLGNGVVPDTAARAFRELWRDLIERG